MQTSDVSRNSVLCLDIGSGTQDVYYYFPDLEPENCPKFVLPSPARRVAERIVELTAAKRGIHLYGSNMGGGFYRALKAHLEAGLPVSSAREAAFSLGDDLDRVEAMGVEIRDDPAPDRVGVALSDYDPGFWNGLMALCGLPQPDLVTACAQDHGFHPGGSNRLGRFELWRTFLDEHQGRPEKLVFVDPPGQLTRLTTLQRAIGGGPVADTGAAAVLGALFEPEVDERQKRQGVCLLNAGNSHIIAFLLYAGRMWGVYEHHTGVLEPDAVWNQLTRFRQGRLGNIEVFDGWGHGCMTLGLPPEAKGFEPTYVLGPQRARFGDFGATMLSPGGDMMLAGCFGLLHGLELLHRLQRGRVDKLRI